MKELIIKKCLKCGATIKVINDCHCDNCGITCCKETMKELKANESDGAIEKHKPICTKEGDYIIVKVDHVMETDHYIEWLCLVTDDKEEYIYLKNEPTAKFKASTGKIYSYCNKH